ncbi:head maturation protease, ClpP-related [Ilyobacter polytropus]|uniref:ATP-dependent Clp protease proteolytic subunit n=1 Tax=Ilyobacter polytropus (strain ATCC 51220 / DSM 2926 / LMG 16218 / CuHBu1) TaxID=572544 RepID=E3HBM4_ILYPC|nr:head maturation protease, ClpP-related [Ilyobacter polytropus]ADO83720.1 peptidase S14 ClpP [Ilyobacter polytropus DSM 2926]
MKNNKFWCFSETGSEKNSEIKIFGEIVNIPCWEGDVSANSFCRELEKIEAEEILVRINSPGGDVFEAQAIYNSLKNHPAKVIVRIDALAASAATVIAMAGDEILMPENAIFMIHNPWSWSSGEAKDFRKKAETMDTIRETIVNVYASKSTLSREEIMNKMDEESWLTSQEAFDAGFITEILSLKAEDSDTEEVNNFMRGRVMNTFKELPKNKFLNLLRTRKNNNKNSKEENMDLKELKESHPDLYNQVVNEASASSKQKERTRIENLEKLQNQFGNFDISDFINNARENGKEANEVMVEIVNSDKFKAYNTLQSHAKESHTETLENVIDAHKEGELPSEENPVVVSEDIMNVFSQNARRGN